MMANSVDVYGLLWHRFNGNLVHYHFTHNVYGSGGRVSSGLASLVSRRPRSGQGGPNGMDPDSGWAQVGSVSMEQGEVVLAAVDQRAGPFGRWGRLRRQPPFSTP